jgi:hypothetical protein
MRLTLAALLVLVSGSAHASVISVFASRADWQAAAQPDVFAPIDSFAAFEDQFCHPSAYPDCIGVIDGLVNVTSVDFDEFAHPDFSNGVMTLGEGDFVNLFAGDIYAVGYDIIGQGFFGLIFSEPLVLYQIFGPMVVDNLTFRTTAPPGHVPAVPEPSSLLLFGAAFALLCRARSSLPSRPL